MDEEKAIEFWEMYKDNFAPVVLLYTKEAVAAIDPRILFMVQPEERRVLSTQIAQNVLLQIGEPLEKVFLLVEAWSSIQDISLKKFIKPALDPNKQEVLVIASKDKNKNVKCISIPIYKIGEERMLDLKNRADFTEKDNLETAILDSFFAGSSAVTN